MKKKVLIVDDDVDDCDLFCDAVLMVDKEVTCEKVYSAKNALALLNASYKPDYIFVDLNMPVTDGHCCLMEIRKINSLDNVPIVMYTTSKRKSDKDSALDLGANYFFTKPSSLDDLCSEISFIFTHNWHAFARVT